MEDEEVEVNPFSFKNFIKKPKEESDLDEDFLIPSQPLKGKKPAVASSIVIEEDIFAPSKPSSTRSSKLIIADDEEDIFAEPTPPIEPTVTKRPGSDAKKVALPLLSSSLEDVEDSIDSSESNEEVLRLRADVEKLTALLARAETRASKAEERAKKAEREVKALKLKEAEEAHALEDAVAMVEKNLQLATDRALKAEAKVAKLKRELKNVYSAAGDNNAHQEAVRQYEATLRAMKEKAVMASDQLHKAAFDAQTAMRQLFAGTETLKNISDILTSIDK
eukprot:Colp12_sorted_trinity150504_noHs@10920